MSIINKLRRHWSPFLAKTLASEHLDPERELTAVGDYTLSLVQRLAKQSSAEVYLTYGTHFFVEVVDGVLVSLTQAIAKSLNLRVFVAGRLGFCTTSDFNKQSLRGVVKQALALAAEVSPDPYQGLPESTESERALAEEVGQQGTADFAERLVKPVDLEIYDPALLTLSTETKIAWAYELAAAASAFSPLIVKVSNSSLASEVETSLLLNSQGCAYTHKRTEISARCQPVARSADNGELQTESWSVRATKLAELPPMAVIGRQAAKRAVRLLGAKTLTSGRLPVIFEPQVTAGLFSNLLGAIDGEMVYKRASFLTPFLGEKLAPKKFTLIDDPWLVGGLKSAWRDAEGLATYPKKIIDGGILRNFLYDSYTARKASAQAQRQIVSTANATRRVGTPPYIGGFNIYVEPGGVEPTLIYQDSPRALLVTRVFGRHLNLFSGDYSRGVQGLLLERGEVVHPVQEVTLAGNCLEMLRDIAYIGNDLHFTGAFGAPTIQIESMIVGGGKRAAS